MKYLIILFLLLSACSDNNEHKPELDLIGSWELDEGLCIFDVPSHIKIEIDKIDLDGDIQPIISFTDSKIIAADETIQYQKNVYGFVNLAFQDGCEAIYKTSHL